MKTTHILSLLLIISSMIGCKTIEPVQTGSNGEYIHSETQVVFPPNLGAFHRGAYNVYDSTGKDISVAYDLYSQNDHIVATIYSYPAPPVTSFGSSRDVTLQARKTLFTHYAEGQVQYLSSKNETAKLVERKQVANEIGTPEISGVFALFRYQEYIAGKNQEVLSELHLFQKDKWLIKYRITYPISSRDNARMLIDQLMEDHKNSQPTS